MAPAPSQRCLLTRDAAARFAHSAASATVSAAKAAYAMESEAINVGRVQRPLLPWAANAARRISADPGEVLWALAM